jgi:hypothetical protein
VLALGLAAEVSETNSPTPKGVKVVLLRADSQSLAGNAYQIESRGDEIILTAANEQDLLYAVFELLERQGMTFGIDGSVVPIDRPQTWTQPPPSEPWIGKPSFSTRGLAPWPDFLNCISVFNKEDFRAYFAAMLRMRLNTFGMHVYTDNEQPTESYLSFEFAGVGQQAVLETTAMRGWGYLPQRTSTYAMGSAQFYDRETFGSDAVRLSADNWEMADRTTAMLRDALSFARDLGIRTGIGFEPYKLPVAISDALPPEAITHPRGFAESLTAKRLLERRLADLLERYPMVDHVWLWEDETSNWQSRAQDVPISVTAFLQAHDFLRRHAPEKRLVVAGWGGFTRHFSRLHELLPGDVVFSALSNTLGWDPVADHFEKLGDRERWPIPWLEDDPSMWFPQFRASRIEDDMKRARNFGCQGMFGIHWRHRIVDPTATYFSRAAWNSSLTANHHYARYARSQAGGERAKALAQLLVDCDMGGAIASTYTGGTEAGGFAGHIDLAADYQEAFKYRENQPLAALLPRQRQTAAKFDQLARSAKSEVERGRLAYLAGFVGLMVPYCDAYMAAHELDAVLVSATKLRNAGDAAAAKELALRDGVPLWIALAPQVRQSILSFQRVVSTRNDLGQLASMQNKLVRIALERLRLSLEELAGELPLEVERVHARAIAPDDGSGPRVFLPTRPSILRPRDSVRLFAVSVGEGSGSTLSLLTRRLGDHEWLETPARHEGRGTFSATLGPFVDRAAAAVEYRLEARGVSGVSQDPPGGTSYIVTILS